MPLPIIPTPMYALFCPSGAPRSTCSTPCSADQTCCGNVCTTPERIPYYSIPSECPSTDLSILIGACNATQRRCLDNSVCASNQLCCRSGACGGKYCKDAVQSNQPCLAVRSFFPSGDELGGIPGAYVPSCQTDGTFAPLQRHGSTGLSWCVNINTGTPVSSFYPRGSTAQCPGIYPYNISYQ